MKKTKGANFREQTSSSNKQQRAVSLKLCALHRGTSKCVLAYILDQFTMWYFIPTYITTRSQHVCSLNVNTNISSTCYREEDEKKKRKEFLFFFSLLKKKTWKSIPFKELEQRPKTKRTMRTKNRRTNWSNIIRYSDKITTALLLCSI